MDTAIKKDFITCIPVSFRRYYFICTAHRAEITAFAVRSRAENPTKRDFILKLPESLLTLPLPGQPMPQVFD